MTDTRPDPGSVLTPAAPPASGAARPNATLILIAVSGLLVSLTQTLLIPAMGQMATGMHVGTAAIEWVLTSTLLVAAVAVPVFGRLGDLYGKRLLLIISLVLLIIGSLISALTSDIAIMITGRAIVGLSMAAIPLGISLISTVLPPERAGTGIALVSAMMGIGGALGLPLAGLVAEHADYHVLFWVCVVGGVLVLAGVFPLVPETPRLARGAFDLTGAVLLAAVLVALLLPLSEAGDWGWGDPRTIGLLIAFAVLAAVFVLVERRQTSPLVDMVVNARPALLLTNVASVCVGFALFATMIGTSDYVQAPAATGYGFGASLVVSGLAMVPAGGMMLVLSLVSPRISARFGPKVTLALGAVIVAAGFAFRIAFTSSIADVYIGTGICGAGTGIAYAAMPSLILLGAPREELAAANGLNSLARSVGSSLASAIGGTILASLTMTLGGFDLPSLSAYRVLFAICAVTAVAGALIALLVPARRPAAA